MFRCGAKPNGHASRAKKVIATPIFGNPLHAPYPFSHNEESWIWHKIFCLYDNTLWLTLLEIDACSVTNSKCLLFVLYIEYQSIYLYITQSIYLYLFIYLFIYLSIILFTIFSLLFSKRLFASISNQYFLVHLLSFSMLRLTLTRQYLFYIRYVQGAIKKYIFNSKFLNFLFFFKNKISTIVGKRKFEFEITIFDSHSVKVTLTFQWPQ